MDTQKLFFNLQKVFYVSILFMFLLSSCKKDQIIEKESISVKGSKDVIPSYNFNWESGAYEDWMPTQNPQTIHTPWFVGVSGSITSTFDDDVYLDHKSADGWVLMYNNFNPNYPTPSCPYFILYNKYRGLMRIYIYNNTSSSFSPSTQLLSGITCNDPNSKLLNFAGNPVVDIAASNQNSYYAVEPGPVNNSMEYPVHPFKWYMIQYELAYDAGLTPTTSQSPPTISWYLNYNNITDISLGGDFTGKITQSTGSGAPGFGSLLSSALSSAPTALGKVAVYSIGAKAFPKLNDSIINKNALGTNIYTAVRAGITSALNSSVAALPGTVFNLLSAIVGGNSGTQKTITSSINAKLTLKGTATERGNLTPGVTNYLPGSLAVDGGGNYYVQSGLTPAYNKPLGVFYLSSAPTISVEVQDENAINQMYNLGLPYNPMPYSVRIRVESCPFIWNPEVLSIADITNINYDIIMYNSNNNYTHTYAHTERLDAGFGNYEFLADDDGFTLYGMGSYTSLGYVYIRVSFNVVPKNGSPASTIIKTFKASTNRHYIFGADDIYWYQ